MIETHRASNMGAGSWDLFALVQQHDLEGIVAKPVPG